MVPGAISTRCSAHERVVQALVVVLGVAAFTAALDPVLYSAARDAPGPAWPMWSRWSSVTHPRVSADPGDLAAFEGLVPDVVEESLPWTAPAWRCLVGNCRRANSLAVNGIV